MRELLDFAGKAFGGEERDVCEAMLLEVVIEGGVSGGDGGGEGGDGVYVLVDEVLEGWHWHALRRLYVNIMTRIKFVDK